jgi:hypothetical protein
MGVQQDLRRSHGVRQGVPVWGSVGALLSTMVEAFRPREPR